MIRVVHSTVSGEEEELRLYISGESIRTFKWMLDRALNCWPDAHPDLKELGDMLTHGRITQDHQHQSTYKGPKV